MATSLLVSPYSCTNASQLTEVRKQRTQRDDHYPQTIPLKSHLSCSSSSSLYVPSRRVVVCVSSSSSPHSTSSTSTRLYISGLSFRTTEESLRNAFDQFGKLVEVNLVMDKIANRPRGFAFISYSTEEESKKAIEGRHGKFLDGRVIFVEVAKPRPETRKNNQFPNGSQR